MNTPRTASLLAPILLAAACHAQTIPCGTPMRVDGYQWGSPLPDFDQRREGLPANGGMFCVPTSFANLMAYYSTHGYPQLFPDYQPTASWTEYDNITANIGLIGVYMQCDAQDGTDREPAFAGGQQWMDQRGGPPMNWSMIHGAEVTPQSMYRVLELGGKGAIAYGRYHPEPGGYLSWGGGHCVTLNSIERLCPQPGQLFNWRVGYRDPASNEDPNDLTAQSIYATSKRGCRVVTATFGTDMEQRTMFEMLVPEADDDIRRFWYTLFSLTPEQTMFRLSALSTRWRLAAAFSIAGETGGNGGAGGFEFDPGATDDTAFGAVPGVAVVLRSQANGGLTPVRLAAWDTMHDTMLAQVPLTGADALLCVGRVGEAHVYNNGLLRSFRLSAGDAPAFSELGTPRSIVSTSGQMVAMGFDDRHDQVLLLRSDGVVVRVGVDRKGVANGAMDSLSLPGSPAFATDGRKRIVPGTSTTSEDYWVGPMTPSTIGGPDTLRRFNRAGTAPTLTLAETLSPPLPSPGAPGSWTNTTEITDWSIADNGRVLLLRGTQMQEVRKVSLFWGNATGSPWYGRTARTAAVVSRSRSQLDRTDPENAPFNLLSPDVAPTETTDCLADIGRTGGIEGRDGALDNNDFVVFIDWFFAHNPGADRGATGGVFGHDGQYNNNDFVVFIDEFFAGCG
jgi:hypothetical protein